MLRIPSAPRRKHRRSAASVPVGWGDTAVAGEAQWDGLCEQRLAARRGFATYSVGRYRAKNVSCAQCLLRAEARCVAHVAGAIGRVSGVDHGSDIRQRHAPLVQVLVNFVGNLLRRPTPNEVVADEVRLADEGLLSLRRPGEADRAQLCAGCLVLRSGGSRYRSATD